MAISFVTGKPGGGKGLVCMRSVIDELRNGDRPIITNLAVKLHPWVRRVKRNGSVKWTPQLGLKSFLLKEYGKDFDCEKRVHLLTDEQAGEFYLYRVENGQLIKAETQKDKDGKVVQFDTGPALANAGVLYIVDEAWKFYGAREWQSTGKGVLFYSAQHRKFGDTLLLCTQNTKQVDTALRQVAEDFWVCTNHSKKTLGMFRQPDMFSIKIYDQVPTTGTLEPMSRKVFKLDKKGLGSCYDTAAGVGLAGNGGADIGEKAKGLPAWTVILFLVAVGFVVIGAAKGFGKVTTHMLTPAKPAASGPAKTETAALGQDMKLLMGKPVPVSTSATEQVESRVVLERVYLTGYSKLNRELFALSDGRMVSETDPGVRVIRSGASVVGLLVDGKPVPWGPELHPRNFTGEKASLTGSQQQ